MGSSVTHTKKFKKTLHLWEGRQTEFFGLDDASMSSAHCWVLHTSCFSSSSHLALNRRRGDAHKLDSQTERLVNTTKQWDELILGSSRPKTSVDKPVMIDNIS